MRLWVTTMLDAGVDLRDVQIAARHADPRTMMRYDIALRCREASSQWEAICNTPHTQTRTA